MRLSDIAVKQGDEVQLAGLTQELRLMKRTSRVTAASHAIRAAVPSVPRFRPVHEEVSPQVMAVIHTCSCLDHLLRAVSYQSTFT